MHVEYAGSLSGTVGKVLPLPIENAVCGKGGGEGMHPSPPSASRLLQKQPMTDSVGTNCSDLPNISKGFQGTQGRGLLPLASYIQCSNRAGS